VREVDVPRALRRLPSLSSRQVVELAELAVTLEARMGWPVDVECAYRDGELYLLQCRPITTLGTFALAA
jgi:pyruvate,water dikinase